MYKYYMVTVDKKAESALPTIAGFSHFGQARRGQSVAYFRIAADDVNRLQDDLDGVLGGSYRFRQSR